MSIDPAFRALLERNALPVLPAIRPPLHSHTTTATPSSAPPSRPDAATPSVTPTLTPTGRGISAPSLPKDDRSDSSGMDFHWEKVSRIAEFRFCPIEHTGRAVEEFHHLAERLRHLSFSPPSLLITSLRRREGRSSVALNLSHALSLLGVQPVVLVDGDPRPDGLTTRLGISSDQADLALVLRGGALEEAVIQSERDGFAFVSAQSAPGKITMTFREARMVDALRRLSHASAMVLIDAPPSSDSAIPALLPLVGGVLFLFRKGETSWEEAKEEAARLRMGGAPILGAVETFSDGK